MRSTVFFKAATLAACLITCNAANAKIETWRLEAIAYQKYDTSFVPPAFASPGNKIIIDYVIDDSFSKNASGIYQDAILSVRFNGETSAPESGYGYILAWDWLNAINSGYWNSRTNDAVDFISLNSWNPEPKFNLLDTLQNISENVMAGTAELRLDFGSESVYATPISLSAVPEPTTVGLFGVGIFAISLVRKRRK